MIPAVWTLLAIPMLRNFECPAAPKRIHIYLLVFQFTVSMRVVLEPMRMVFLQYETEEQCLKLLGLLWRH